MTTDLNQTNTTFNLKGRRITLACLVLLPIIPVLLNLLGLNFGSNLNETSFGGQGLVEYDLASINKTQTLEGAIYHALFEWSAVSVAMFAGTLSLVHFQRFGNSAVLFLGLAFFCTGILDAFHVFSTSQIVSSQEANADLSPFSWVLSRLFNSSAIIVALAIGIWIHKRNVHNISRNQNALFDRNILISVSALFLLTISLIIFLTLKSATIPKTTFPLGLLTRPFDVLPLAIYLLAAVFCWIWWSQEKTILKLAVLLSFIPQVAAQFHMSFGSVEFYDSHFNIGHLLKVLAYNYFCGGLLLDFLQGPISKALPIKDYQIKQNAIEGMVEVGEADRPQAIIIPVAAFLLATTLTILVGGSFYFDSSQMIKQQELNTVVTDANSIEPIIKNLFESSSSDVRFLSRIPPIQGIISALERKDNEDYIVWKDRMEQIFSERVSNSSNYLQIRFIGLADNGKELVNVSRINGLIYQIPNSRLQEKGQYDYVNDTVKLLPNQVYFSKIEFNREFGKITVPYQPVLRVGTPIFHPRTGEPFGIIIINIDINAFLDTIKKFNTDELTVYLANFEGDYILHPEEEKQFSFELGNSYLMQTEFQQINELLIQDVEEYVFENVIIDNINKSNKNENYYGYYRTIHLEEFGFGRPLQLLITIDGQSLQQKLSDFRNRSLLLGLALVIIALALAIYVSRRFVSPLTQTAEVLDHYEATGELQALPLNSRDETGVLARRFQNLLVQRHAQDKEIADQKFANDQHTIVAVTDVTGTITYANDKFCEISGYKLDELIGSNHRLLNSGYHEKDFFRDMYLQISKGKVWHGQICNKAKSGTFYWVATTIVPILDNHGKPRQYIALRTDITKQKEVEAELILAKEAAEEAVLAKSEFLASMSHEIRTPMNGVLGMLNLLTRSELNKDQQKWTSLAQDSAQSLLVLINDILDYSKVEAGKLELEIIDFDVRKLMGDFAESMAFRAHEKNLELVLDVSNIKVSHVLGDPGRLRQILTNLVANAIKFTETGEIYIKAGLEDAKNSGLIFTCRIEDTGLGIPENKIDSLFDSFTQVDASTTRKYGGTGLGLSIVKKLCLLMDGSISVHSVLGQGSSFEFTVRLDVSAETPKAFSSFEIENINALVVDDNRHSQTVICEQLSSWGVEVKSAADGNEAFSILEKTQETKDQTIDIVFIDMDMPRINGIDLVKKIRLAESFKNVKLIMMMSSMQKNVIGEYNSVGFDSYFAKPATASDLHDAITEVLNKHPVRAKIKNDAENKKLISSTNEKTITKKHWPLSTRILLVEDNSINQEVALGLLKQIDLRADIAGNGQEAIDALLQAPTEAPYTFIFMDCQMPVLDGYQTTAQIREGRAGNHNRDIPIVAMTANAMKGDKEKCFEVGMVDYISKPVNLEQIKTVLQRWLLGDELMAYSSNSITISGPDIDTNENSEADKVWDEAGALKRVGGKDERLRLLIDLYFKNMPERMLRLEEAIDNKQLDIVIDTAHEIKGVLGNLSAISAMQSVSDVELAGKEGDTECLERCLPVLINQYSQVNKVFGEYLNRPQ